MSRFVSDTHALVWHLTDDATLSPAARQVLRDADRGDHLVLVPGIVLVEMIYLLERGTISEQLLERLLVWLAQGTGGYTLAALNEATVDALRRVPRADVPDMPDRIIVATALQLGLPLISRDAAIRRAGIVPVIW